MREVADLRIDRPEAARAEDLALADRAVALELEGRRRRRRRAATTAAGLRRNRDPLASESAAAGDKRLRPHRRRPGHCRRRRCLCPSRLPRRRCRVRAQALRLAWEQRPGAEFSVTAICGIGGTTTCGLGAATGVASLLMFGGAAPPSFSLGLACCLGGGGGGGGGGFSALMSNTRIASCAPGKSTRPEMFSKANSSAAWIATTAAIAPPLSLASRSDRYIAPI